MITWEFIIGHLNYWFFIVLMMTGLYIVIAKGNLVKKVVGLNIFQTSVFMFYVLFLLVVPFFAKSIPNFL